MRFGFSYVGLAFLLMLTVPNLLWTKNKPSGYDKYAARENSVLLIFERVGQVLVTCTALIFADFNIRADFPWLMWLIAAAILMLMYEAYWIGYFHSPKTLKNFYTSFLGIPVAGATLPVCAFFLLGIYGKNIIMLVSVVILGIGHIGIHLQHSKETE